MTLEEAIQPTPKCPWCGSTSRVPSRAFTSKPNRYLISLAEKLGVSTESMIEKMQAVECLDCGTSFCDPWLSPAATTWLFSIGYPQHNAAWKTFYHWLDRTDEFETQVFTRKEKIWRTVESRIGPVNSYGEIGCPFMGLFTYFQCCKAQPAASFARFVGQSLEQAQTRKHPTFVPRLRPLQRAVLVARFWKNRLRWTKRSPASSRAHAHVPSELYFVRSPSSLLWGTNCVSLSTSCAAMALANLEARIVELSEISLRFDALAFFNTLDHQDAPLGVLEKALQAARFVIVELHRDSTAGKQHLYVINEALSKTARQKGWHLEEFSESVDGGKGDQLYIISREGSPIEPASKDQAKP